MAVFGCFFASFLRFFSFYLFDFQCFNFCVFSFFGLFFWGCFCPFPNSEKQMYKGVGIAEQAGRRKARQAAGKMGKCKLLITFLKNAVFAGKIALKIRFFDQILNPKFRKIVIFWFRVAIFLKF